MLAEKNEYIADTIITIRELSADEKIRQQCEAREKYNWDMAAATAKGQREGLAEGMVKGRTLTLITQVCRKLQKGKEPEVIADELEEDLAFIAQICDIAKEYAPEYNTEAIHEALQKKTI